jgi:hypothetical protein
VGGWLREIAKRFRLPPLSHPSLIFNFSSNTNQRQRNEFFPVLDSQNGKLKHRIQHFVADRTMVYRVAHCWFRRRVLDFDSGMLDMAEGSLCHFLSLTILLRYFSNNSPLRHAFRS